MRGTIILVLFAAGSARAQSPAGEARSSERLALGFAVDTTVRPDTWWGVDPARAALPRVVRAWRDYLAARADPARRVAFWSADDRARTPDPDLLAASESYVFGAHAVLVEALPIVAGDSSRWLLRTVYVGGGTATRPGLLGMERSYLVLENGRWLLTSTSMVETAGWKRVREGAIEYVVHPSLAFDPDRARATARWADSTARRFGLSIPATITYYQTPDLDAAFRVMGLDWALSADRVGGRANPSARVVFAADPRFGEAYRHELAHVILAPIVGGTSAFVGEGIAYWLGGARGARFTALMTDLAHFLEAHPSLDLRAILDSAAAPTAASARLPAAAAVFELAHRRGGDPAVRRFIDALGSGEPTLARVARALGMAPDECGRAWRALVMSFAGAPGGRAARVPRVEPDER